MYIQYYQELADNIINHQINIDKCKDIINGLNIMKEPFPSPEIFFRKKYYINDVIKEYKINITTKTKEELIYKEKIIEMRQLNEKYMLYNKKIKPISYINIMDLNYIEAEYLVIIDNNVQFIFTLNKYDQLIVNTIDDIFNNINEFSSISFKINTDGTDISQICEFLDNFFT